MPTRPRLARAFALMLLAAGPAGAVELPAGDAPRVAFTPRDVTDEGHLVLADGGVVILAGLAPGDAGLRAALEPRLTRRFARVDEGLPDRYRRIRAQVVVDDEWLQAELVAAGLARVGVDPAARRTLPDLLRLEQAARAARRGRWGDGGFRVLDAAALGFVAEGFHILEGRVERVTAQRGASQIVLAAGTPRRALTIIVPANARAALRRAGVVLDGLAGRRLRVRGHVAWRGGLTIEATMAEQIELEP